MQTASWWITMLLVVLGLGSCGKAKSETESAASEDAGPVDASGGHDAERLRDGSAEADRVEGGSGGAADASFDAGDPGWKPVDWAPGCMDVATRPAEAVPELVWTDCGAGCARLVPNWPDKSGTPLHTAQVYKSGSVLRVGLHMWYGEIGQWRKAIYDENMKPLVAWRGDECGANLLQWTPKHVCLSLGQGLDPTIEAFLSPADLTGSPIAVYAKESTVPISCNEDLFIASSLGGIPYLRDLGTGLVRWIQFPDGQATDAVPVGPRAFFVLMGYDNQGHDKLTGWVWKRPDTLEQLVDAGSEMVYDIRSDGETLVWVQTTSTSVFDVAPGTLWTSPFATSASEVHGTARRAVPSISLAPSTKAANQGYYAFIEVSPTDSGYDRSVHVYRLSDAHHWHVPTIPDVMPADVIFLDAEEVWYLGTTLNGARSTIIRMRLEALGAGD